jgi:hypothetical protein
MSRIIKTSQTNSKGRTFQKRHKLYWVFLSQFKIPCRNDFLHQTHFLYDTYLSIKMGQFPCVKSQFISSSESTLFETIIQFFLQWCTNSVSPGSLFKSILRFSSKWFILWSPRSALFSQNEWGEVFQSCVAYFSPKEMSLNFVCVWHQNNECHLDISEICWSQTSINFLIGWVQNINDWWNPPI